MDINSELKDAQLEILDADHSYSGNRKGLIWFNRASDKIKAVFNSEVKSIVTNDELTAALLESAIYPLCEVKFAMLDEAQFQTTYSANWLKIDGQTLLASSYPALAALRPEWVSGLDITLPSGGDFLRVNTARALGEFEDDLYESHNHGGGNHSHKSVSATSGSPNINSLPYLASIGNSGPYGYSNYQLYSTNTVPTRGQTSNSGTIITTQGGVETRPKNIAINAFIKVK
jgi:hypothetical protein